MKNAEIDRRMASLEPFLAKSGMVGYAAARNYRLMGNTIVEYLARKDELVMKHGDQDGQGNWSVSPSSDGWECFVKELQAFADIEHDFEPFKAKYSDVVGELTGAEILEIDWMLED